MIFSDIRVSIYPDLAFGQNAYQNAYRLEMRCRDGRSLDWHSITKIIDDDHLHSLFDLIFDGLKEELRRGLENVK